jgi:hypothetical protein
LAVQNLSRQKANNDEKTLKPRYKPADAVNRKLHQTATQNQLNEKNVSKTKSVW